MFGIFLAYWLVSVVVPAASQAIEVPHIPGRFFGLPGVNATFDYVVSRMGVTPDVSLMKDCQVIGGGTAGLTIAERLAETANISVAIIEAGGFYQVDAGNVTEIPAYDSRAVSGLSAKTKVDWGFVTQPQEVRDNYVSTLHHSFSLTCRKGLWRP